MLDTNFWKKYFAEYDILNEFHPYQELLDTFVDVLDLSEGERVLDAGTGTGNLAYRLKRSGVVITGIDFSSEGLLRFKEKLPGHEALLHDLTKPLPLPDESFDVVVSNNVLYTLPPEGRLSVLKEFHRVLKPGGRVAIANIREKFSPMAIYLAHIRTAIKRQGILRACKDIIRSALSVMKIGYYNLHIKKEHAFGEYAFFKQGEQEELLRLSGFHDISDTLQVYANQGVFTSAKKPDTAKAA